MKALLIITFLLPILFGFKSDKSYKADEIEGYWISPENDLIVKCYKYKDLYYSRVVWFKKYYDYEPINPNGVPENKWIGTVVMKNFKYSENEWAGGEIHNLKNGKKYSAYLELKSQNTLEVTGFVLFRFLSETVQFTKYTNSSLPAFN